MKLSIFNNEACKFKTKQLNAFTENHNRMLIFFD